MTSIENTRAKVRNCQKIYRKAWPKEYEAVVEIVKEKRAKLHDEVLGGMADGKEHAFKRQLLEYSEKLSLLLVKNLDDEEYKWFSSTEGQRWFAKEFPMYRIPKEI